MVSEAGKAGHMGKGDSGWMQKGLLCRRCAAEWWRHAGAGPVGFGPAVSGMQTSCTVGAADPGRGSMTCSILCVTRRRFDGVAGWRANRVR